MNSNNNLSILDHLKKKSVKRFSLFFIAAFVLLIISKLSNDYKQTINLKIKLVDFEDEIVFKNDSSNYINAYVEAKGFSFVPFVFSNYKDLIVNAKTDVAKKTNHFIFDVQKNRYIIEDQLGKSFKLLSVKPDTLFVAYSKRASKKVPIVLNQSINYAVGYDLKSDFKFNIDSVKIVGSANLVNEIASISTKELILNEVNTNITQKLELDISAYKDIEIFPKSVTVSGEVSRFTEGTIEVPFTIINQPRNVNLNYFPKAVTISYYVDLENYNAVKASNFVVECDFNDIRTNQTYLVPKVVKKPEFIKHISIKQKRIDFIKL